MIRRANINDLAQLVALEKKTFHDPWPESEYVYELSKNPFAKIFVYEEDNEILGFVDLWILYEQAQIANIAVLSDVQKKGIGSALMELAVKEAIKEECENLSLEVRVSNAKAIGLYEKFKFINVNVRKKYYEDGEDAYLMVKPLGGLTYDNVIGY